MKGNTADPDQKNLFKPLLQLLQIMVLRNKFFYLSEKGLAKKM